MSTSVASAGGAPEGYHDRVGQAPLDIKSARAVGAAVRESLASPAKHRRRAQQAQSAKFFDDELESDVAAVIAQHKKPGGSKHAASPAEALHPDLFAARDAAARETATRARRASVELAEIDIAGTIAARRNEAVGRGRGAEDATDVRHSEDSDDEALGIADVRSSHVIAGDGARSALALSLLGVYGTRATNSAGGASAIASASDIAVLNETQSCHVLMVNLGLPKRSQYKAWARTHAFKITVVTTLRDAFAALQPQGEAIASVDPILDGGAASGSSSAAESRLLQRVDVVFADLAEGAGPVLDLLTQIRGAHLSVPVLLATPPAAEMLAEGSGAVLRALGDCQRLGISGALEKPLDLPQMAVRVRVLVERSAKAQAVVDDVRAAKASREATRYRASQQQQQHRKQYADAQFADGLAASAGAGAVAASAAAGVTGPGSATTRRPSGAAHSLSMLGMAPADGSGVAAAALLGESVSLATIMAVAEDAERAHAEGLWLQQQAGSPSAVAAAAAAAHHGRMPGLGLRRSSSSSVPPLLSPGTQAVQVDAMAARAAVASATARQVITARNAGGPASRVRLAAMQPAAFPGAVTSAASARVFAGSASARAVAVANAAAAAAAGRNAADGGGSGGSGRESLDFEWVSPAASEWVKRTRILQPRDIAEAAAAAEAAEEARALQEEARREAAEARARQARAEVLGLVAEPEAPVAAAAGGALRRVASSSASMFRQLQHNGPKRFEDPIAAGAGAMSDGVHLGSSALQSQQRRRRKRSIVADDILMLGATAAATTAAAAAEAHAGAAIGAAAAWRPAGHAHVFPEVGAATVLAANGAVFSAAAIDRHSGSSSSSLSRPVSQSALDSAAAAAAAQSAKALAALDRHAAAVRAHFRARAHGIAAAERRAEEEATRRREAAARKALVTREIAAASRRAQTGAAGSAGDLVASLAATLPPLPTAGTGSGTAPSSSSAAATRAAALGRAHEVWLASDVLAGKPREPTEGQLPSTTRAHQLVRRGLGRHRLGEEADAVALFTQALRADPKLASARLLRGAALFCAGRLEAALADFDACLAAGGARRDDNAAYNRALTLACLGDAAGALEALGALLEASPRDVDALQLRGLLHRRARQYGAAQGDYAAVLYANISRAQQLSAAEAAQLTGAGEPSASEAYRAALMRMGEGAGSRSGSRGGSRGGSKPGAFAAAFSRAAERVDAAKRGFAAADATGAVAARMDAHAAAATAAALGDRTARSPPPRRPRGRSLASAASAPALHSAGAGGGGRLKLGATTTTVAAASSAAGGGSCGLRGAPGSGVTTVGGAAASHSLSSLSHTPAQTGVQLRDVLTGSSDLHALIMEGPTALQAALATPPSQRTDAHVGAVAAVLRSLVFFRGLAAAGQRGFARACFARTYAEGEVVCAEGEPVPCLYVVLSGECVVRVTVGGGGSSAAGAAAAGASDDTAASASPPPLTAAASGGGTEITVDTLGAGDVFGHLPLLFGDARTLTVVARSAAGAELVLLPRSVFFRLGLDNLFLDALERARGVLRRTGAFASLPDADLLKLCCTAKWRQHRKHDLLLRQGDLPKELMVLTKGIVHVYKTSDALADVSARVKAVEDELAGLRGAFVYHHSLRRASLSRPPSLPSFEPPAFSSPGPSSSSSVVTAAGLTGARALVSPLESTTVDFAAAAAATTLAVEDGGESGGGGARRDSAGGNAPPPPAARRASLLAKLLGPGFSGATSLAAAMDALRARGMELDADALAAAEAGAAAHDNLRLPAAAHYRAPDVAALAATFVETYSAELMARLEGLKRQRAAMAAEAGLGGGGEWEREGAAEGGDVSETAGASGGGGGGGRLLSRVLVEALYPAPPSLLSALAVSDPWHGYEAGDCVAETYCELLVISKAQIDHRLFSKAALAEVALKAPRFPPDAVIIQRAKDEAAWRAVRVAALATIDKRRWPLASHGMAVRATPGGGQVVVPVPGGRPAKAL